MFDQSDYTFFFPLCSHFGACSHFWSIGLISQFLDHSQTVGLLGRVISSSQGLYLNREQHKHRKTHTHIKHPCREGIRTHDPGLRASEDSSCFRPLCCRDWLSLGWLTLIHNSFHIQDWCINFVPWGIISDVMSKNRTFQGIPQAFIPWVPALPFNCTHDLQLKLNLTP
jgi:hypothetical protein